MKKNWKILIILILFFNQACGDRLVDCHKTITFTNKTSDTLYVISAYEYPDTMAFRILPNPLLDPYSTQVFPYEDNTKVLFSRDCLELVFKDFIPYDTLMVYVFDGQVLKTHPWDSVKANYLVLKRYDLSLEDLVSMNWEITFP